MKYSENLKNVKLCISKSEFIDKTGKRCCIISIDGITRVLYQGNSWFWVRHNKAFTRILGMTDTDGYIYHHPLLYKLRKEYRQPYQDKVKNIDLSDFHDTSEKINILAQNTNYGKSTLALQSIVNNPDKSWIYTARETDTLDKFKFDLLALSDRKLKNKIVVIHSQDSSDLKIVVDTIKLYESIEMSHTFSLAKAKEKYHEGNPKECLTDEDIENLSFAYEEGGMVPIHYRKILLITHSSFSSNPINFWQGTFDSTGHTKRKNLIIDEFTPLHVNLTFSPYDIDNVISFILEQKQIRAIKRSPIISAAVFHEIKSIKKLVVSYLIDYQDNTALPALINGINPPTFTQLLKKQQEFTTKIAKDQWAGYMIRSLNELFDNDINIINNIRPKLLGNNSTTIGKIISFKNHSLIMYKERLIYYFSIILDQINNITINAEDEIASLNVNLLLGWEEDSNGIYDFEQVYLLDATGDLIFNNIKKYNIHTNDKKRDFTVRYKKNLNLLKDLKYLTKVRITKTKESLDTYIKECSISLKEICDEIISECNIRPEKGIYQIPILVATIANDADHKSSKINFDKVDHKARGTNISQALISYMLKKYKHKISAIGFNSSKAIGYNGFSDYKYFVLAGEYWHNKNAQKVFNEMTDNITKDIHWKQRAVEQVVGRIARDGSPFVIYSLLSERKTKTLLSRLTKEVEEGPKEKKINKTIANKIQILFDTYPSFKVEKNLQITLDEIYQLIKMSRKKSGAYKDLIKNLESLGYKLEINSRN